MGQLTKRAGNQQPPSSCIRVHQCTPVLTSPTCSQRRCMHPSAIATRFHPLRPAAARNLQSTGLTGASAGIWLQRPPAGVGGTNKWDMPHFPSPDRFPFDMDFLFETITAHRRLELCIAYRTHLPGVAVRTGAAIVDGKGRSCAKDHPGAHVGTDGLN